MKKLFPLAIAALAIAACADDQAITRPTVERGDATPSFAKAADGEAIPGQYIVVFKDNVADSKGKAKEKVGKAKGHLKQEFSRVLKGFAAELSDAAVAELAKDPDVAYIEQDQVMTATTTQSGATWGLDRVDQRALPLSGTWTYAANGSGVTAYIVDTGILTSHSEFGGRARVGYDAVGDGRNGIDCNGHGTHVAGTVGGATYGIAKGVTLVAVRVLDCGGSGTTSGVIAGVDWVASNHAAGTPAVANMSLGGGASTALDNAVANAIADGVTFGVAAGNGNFLGIAQDACKSSPARVATAITVGATDATDKKASWSNYGSCLDLFAPGVNITSSWYSSATATNTISGTSMATPHVVGVAALYLQGNPSASPATVASALVANSTTGKVTSAGRNSPNRLLFSNY